MNRYDLSKMDTDFIGFTFNGKHSADFGILRTSDGDRYEESFVPDISDEAEAIPGGHGEYYVGETIKSKGFKIEFAYDCLNEIGLRRIRKWLHPDDQLHELIFDERPYVKYWVKCSKAVTSKGLCFNQYNDSTGKIERVYKGEGTIEFTAYMPYGIEVNKDLNYFTNANKDEWRDAAGLIEEYIDSGIDVFSKINGGHKAEIYNPGEMESDFILEFDCKVNNKNSNIVFYEDNQRKDGYMLTTDTKWKEDTAYYIIYKNFLCKIEKEDEGYFVTNEEEKWEGYFDESDSYSIKFISNITGIIYDIYVATDNNIIRYVCDEKIGEINQCVWVSVTDARGETSIKQILFLSSDEQGKIAFQVFDNKKVKAITIPDMVNISLRIAVVDRNTTDTTKKDGYEIELNIPSIGTSSPEDYTETQKMVASGQWHMVIDTAKKVIKWNTDADSSLETFTPYVGVAEIIKAGNWFKIPLDDILEEPIESYNKLVISRSDGSPTWLEISNPKLTYHYMYK